jgi:hypothetical protein
MTTTENPHVWFCRECKKKGSMFSKDAVDLAMVKIEHGISSPTCGGLVHIVPATEVEQDLEINSYKDWDD